MSKMDYSDTLSDVELASLIVNNANPMLGNALCELQMRRVEAKESAMPPDMGLVFHSTWPDERKEVASIAGVKIYADPGLPDEEVRIVQGNRVVESIRLF